MPSHFNIIVGTGGESEKRLSERERVKEGERKRERMRERMRERERE